MAEFTGKVALVTGGSRGIGNAIALELARRGADVAFNYLRNHTAARQAEQELKNLGVQTLRVRAHLGDPKRIVELFAAIKKTFGRLDLLVNNAASGVERPALELETKHWEWTQDINTRAAWLCAKEAVGLMPSGGVIVNLSSLGSQRVLPYYTAVGVSKAGLEALTRYLAVELAPRGISVNAISAGFVDTDALRHFPNAEEMLTMGREKTPVGRILTPEDIARVVALLCSEDANMVRGQTIVVDGGMSIVV